jgi:uncharacterized protein (DUF1697 family)
MNYAAFFRGINVGGRNKVKMADLKQLFHDCGFSKVETYIQSGNVLFESDEDEYLLPDIIFHAFTERFGFQSHVVLRSRNEIYEIISALPFSNKEIEQAVAKNPEVEHVYVFLSNGNIDPKAIETLCLAYDGEDKLLVGKRELYLLCYQSVRNSKLAMSLSKLNVSLTSRNLKTMLKIYELLGTTRLN